MHRGYFKTLKQVAHLCNIGDAKRRCESLEPPIIDTTGEVALANRCWPASEVDANVNSDELGDLGLTDEEEDALVAFVMAKSDGYIAP